VLGPDHPNTLTARNSVAGWIGSTGDPREALRLCQALLPDVERVLGPGDPETLRTRHIISHGTGGSGDAGEAMRLCKALLPDVERVLGPDHPKTLTTRFNIAFGKVRLGMPVRSCVFSGRYCPIWRAYSAATTPSPWRPESGLKQVRSARCPTGLVRRVHTSKCGRCPWPLRMD
jgi:hypothetical protein